MTDPTRVTIHAETYRAYVEARRQRAYSRSLCLRVQHRLSMTPPVPLNELEIVILEAAELRAEALEMVPELGIKN